MRGAGMRVLMTVEAVGGVWTYATELVAALAPRGVEFVVACAGPAPGAGQREEMRRAGCERIECGEYRLEWMPEAWHDVDRAGEWLLDLAREHGVDLVHLNGFCHGALPFGVPAVVVGHSCVLSWWEAVCEGRAPCQWDEYRRRVTEGLRGADAVVAPTEWMLGELRRLYENLWRARVISGGRTLPRGAAVRKEPVVFAAGGVWDEAKNVGLLARVAAELPWECQAAGEDVHVPGRRPAREALRALGRLTPGQMWERLARASIFVHPARYEPFGLAPLEAAMSGCALVLGDIPSLREVWGEAAAYIGPDDADGLRKTVGRLIENHAERKRLARAAGERARLYSADRVGEAYAGLYSELLSGAWEGAAPRARAGAA
jgi:glycogen synthase